jgi:hypothetical protein
MKRCYQCVMGSSTSHQSCTTTVSLAQMMVYGDVAPGCTAGRGAVNEFASNGKVLVSVRWASAYLRAQNNKLQDKSSVEGHLLPSRLVAKATAAQMASEAAERAAASRTSTFASTPACRAAWAHQACVVDIAVSLLHHVTCSLHSSNW